jgi:hypothetical protein
MKSQVILNLKPMPVSLITELLADGVARVKFLIKIFRLLNLYIYPIICEGCGLTSARSMNVNLIVDGIICYLADHSTLSTDIKTLMINSYTSQKFIRHQFIAHSGWSTFLLRCIQ